MALWPCTCGKASTLAMATGAVRCWKLGAFNRINNSRREPAVAWPSPLRPPPPIQPGGIAILDAFNVAGDGVSSVSAYGSSLPSMGQVSTLGLATAFAFTPVPEPSTWALLIVGLAAMVFLMKRMGKHKEGTNAAD